MAKNNSAPSREAGAKASKVGFNRLLQAYLQDHCCASRSVP